MFVIESDATVVAPLMLSALLEARANPEAANTLIEKWMGGARTARRPARRARKKR